MPAKKTSAKKPAAKKKTSTKVKTATKKTAVKKTVAKKTTKPAAKKKVVKKVAVKSKTVEPTPVSKKAKITPKQLLWPIVILIVLAAAWLLKDQVIVATVNGRPIMRTTLIKELESQGGSQVLESLITQVLVEQALAEAEVEVSEEEVAAQMQDIEDTIAAQGQDFEELLELQGLTREDVEKDVRLNLQVDQLLADQIQVSDQEVEAYFESNKELLGEEADFDMMKDQIRAQLEQEKTAEAQQAWLDEIRNEAKIQYFRFEPQTNMF